MSAQSAHGYLGIGEVLAQLRGDFPDVSVSKIRFLETEGLISPARSPSGYRRFCAADVDRLRFILAAQRDQYLPLRVIRERLDRLGQAAGGPADGPPGNGRPAGGPRFADSRLAESRSAESRSAESRSVQPGSAGSPTFPGAGEVLLSRRELLAEAGLTEALLTELETFGLLRRVGRSYGPDALQVARTAVALTAYGVEARHLRAVRAAAERETTMIESLVAPMLRQRGSGARDFASRTAAELADLVLRLHGALVDGALAEAGLAGAGSAGAGSAGAGRAGAGPARTGAAREGRAGRDVEGASA
jgi:DNA-binding transcriptional MerR regulator